MTVALVAQFLRRLRHDPSTQALTIAQLRFLATLASLGCPTKISDVARTAGMNRHQASLIASALLESGLIQRRADQIDLRVRVLELTREGRAVCDKLAKMLPSNETGAG